MVSLRLWKISIEEFSKAMTRCTTLQGAERWSPIILSFYVTGQWCERAFSSVLCEEELRSEDQVSHG